jgi:hypothetical protein
MFSVAAAIPRQWLTADRLAAEAALAQKTFRAAIPIRGACVIVNLFSITKLHLKTFV